MFRGCTVKILPNSNWAIFKYHNLLSINMLVFIKTHSPDIFRTNTYLTRLYSSRQLASAFPKAIITGLPMIILNYLVV